MSKRFNAVIGSIAINLQLTNTHFPENITSKPSITMGHTSTTVVQKGSEHRSCQKTKRKRKEEHFGPASSNCSTTSGGISIIQGLCYGVNLRLNKLLKNCWIPLRNTPSFVFHLCFDRSTSEGPRLASDGFLLFYDVPLGCFRISFRPKDDFLVHKPLKALSLC